MGNGKAWERRWNQTPLVTDSDSIKSTTAATAAAIIGFEKSYSLRNSVVERINCLELMEERILIERL